MTWWRRWRRQRRCTHGRPEGESWVHECGAPIAQVRTVQCLTRFGGCGQVWRHLA